MGDHLERHMWMDMRAHKEAAEVAGTGDPCLRYVGGGNVSAEWFPCKMAWVKKNERRIYDNARTVFEQTDWLAFRLTGERTIGLNTATIRWFYNINEGGLPTSFYKRVGLEDLLPKTPQRVVRIGEMVGGPTKEMAELTSLPAVLLFTGGSADGYSAVIGINAMSLGTIALITGSSHVQVGITDKEVHARGLFGSYPDVLLPGLQAIEGGQVSTGSVLRWFISAFVGKEVELEAARAGVSVYDELNARATAIAPGSEGCLVLDHWQGNRTPWTDPLSRGVIRGLTLSHTPAHIYRAIIERGCIRDRSDFPQLETEGVRIDRVIACGGATQSALWMKTHSDVSGKAIAIPYEQQAATLGSAIAATVAGGLPLRPAISRIRHGTNRKGRRARSQSSRALCGTSGAVHHNVRGVERGIPCTRRVAGVVRRCP